MNTGVCRISQERPTRVTKDYRWQATHCCDLQVHQNLSQRVPVIHRYYRQNIMHALWTHRLTGTSRNWSTFWCPLITSGFVLALGSRCNWLVIKHISIHENSPMFTANTGEEGRVGFKLHPSLQLSSSGYGCHLSLHWRSLHSVRRRHTAVQPMDGTYKHLFGSCLASRASRNNTWLVFIKKLRAGGSRGMLAINRRRIFLPSSLLFKR
jgi:hypothetical protein